MFKFQLEGINSFCDNILEIKLNDKVKLKRNINNKLSSNAIGVYTSYGKKIGYASFIFSQHNIKGIYRQFYSRLNTIGKYRKKSFNLIGGLSDLVIDYANDFENLNFLIPSWQSLLNPEHTTTYLDQVGLEYLDKHFQNKQEIVPFIDNFLKMSDFFSGNKEFFWQDGMHPNRLGHRVLCDAIKTELNL